MNYECSHGQTWVRTLDDEQMLFKYYDAAIREEKDVKKIKDE